MSGTNYKSRDLLISRSLKIEQPEASQYVAECLQALHTLNVMPFAGRSKYSLQLLTFSTHWLAPGVLYARFHFQPAGGLASVGYFTNRGAAVEENLFEETDFAKLLRL